MLAMYLNYASKIDIKLNDKSQFIISRSMMNHFICSKIEFVRRPTRLTLNSNNNVVSFNPINICLRDTMDVCKREQLDSLLTALIEE